MISYIDGDLFRSSAKVLVCSVNPNGNMDEGLASQFRKRSAKLYKAYRDLCELEQVKVGTLFLYKTRSRWILCFPTREDMAQPSSLEMIETGLKRFLEVNDEMDLQSIAFPKLGCGSGGLDWKDVKPLMAQYLEPLDLEIEIYNYVPGPYYPSVKLNPRFGNGECLVFA